MPAFRMPLLLAALERLASLECLPLEGSDGLTPFLFFAMAATRRPAALLRPARRKSGPGEAPSHASLRFKDGPK